MRCLRSSNTFMTSDSNNNKTHARQAVRHMMFCINKTASLFVIMISKRQSLTNETKLKILQSFDENHEKAAGVKWKLGEIAEEYGIKQCNLSSIATKKFRMADKFPEIDEALLCWFKSCSETNIAMSDEILKRRTNDADFHVVDLQYRSA